MLDALQSDPMRNALLAGALAAFACGIIGAYVVVRKMVSISGGISHGSLGGVGLGYYFGVNTLLGALGFALLAAIGMGFLTRRTKISEDTAIGLIWATGMSLGVLFIGLKPGFAPDLAGFLFGSITLVSKSNLIFMGVLDGVILLTVVLLYKEFLAISFDEEFGNAIGIPVQYLYLVLLVLIALTVVVVLKVVGIVLLIALLTLPAAMSRQYVSDLKKIMFLAIPIGIAFTIGGIWISYEVELAFGIRLTTGPTIILFGGLIFAVSAAVSRILARRGNMYQVERDESQGT